MKEETREERFARHEKTLLDKLTLEEKEEAKTLSEFELYQIAEMLNRNASFPNAIAVYGNTVEGDMTQLSSQMRKLYRKYRRYGRVKV